MASTRNVVVNFITKLSGRGIEQMGRQSRGLDRSLGLLQKRLLAIVSFGAFFRYIKNSTKAFAEETGQVRQLELALSNLGLAYSALTIEDTVQELQRLTAVSDDELRPALAQLVRQTASVTKATDLLTLATNVSLGTGRDLASVSRALGRAYDGQTTALRRLDTGISSAVLESKDFNRIQAELQDKFGGAAAADLATYNGKMRALAVASEQAREAIGEGVVKGIEALGEGNFQKGLEDLVTLAEKIGRGFELAGRAAARLREFLSAPVGSLGDQASLTGRFLAQDIAPDAAERRAQSRDVDLRLKLERKALRELARLRAQERAKDRAEERRKAAVKEAERRKDELRKRLEEKFDIDAINLNAALGKKLSEEDATRVKALQALRTEGAKDDETALQKLQSLEKQLEDQKTKAVLKDIALSGVLRNTRIDDLNAELAKLKEIQEARRASIGAPVTSAEIDARAAAGDFFGAAQLATQQALEGIDATLTAEIAAVEAQIAAETATGLAATVTAATQQVINNYVTVTGSVIREQDLFDSIFDQIYTSNRTGRPSQLGGLGRTGFVTE
jgi:hypothetical protein